MNLKIIKAKPNPAGKDKIGNLYPQQQLAGEWIDIQNVTDQPMNLDYIKVYHWAYKRPKPGWEEVTDFQGTLPPYEIVRIHSGNEIPLNQLQPEDFLGAHHHIFSGKNYVWNNDKEDLPSIWNTSIKKWIDRTSYDAFPLDGKILNRINDKLV